MNCSGLVPPVAVSATTAASGWGALFPGPGFIDRKGTAIERGAVQGVNEAGKGGKVLVAGYDSGKAQIDAIKNGTEMGAITQNPVGIGQQCVIAAVKAIQGTGQPTKIDTGFYWYDKTNITDTAIVADLYQ